MSRRLPSDFLTAGGGSDGDSNILSGGGVVRSGFGPLKWMAPESMQAPFVFSPSSDAFMFGTMLWELLAERSPFADLSPEAAAARVLEGTSQQARTCFRCISGIARARAHPHRRQFSQCSTMSSHINALKRNMHHSLSLVLLSLYGSSDLIGLVRQAIACR